MKRANYWVHALMLIALSVLAQNAQAATCTSKTGGPYSWSSASTWTGCNNRAPRDGDAAIISGGSTVTLNNDTNQLVSLTVQAGGVLQGDNRGGQNLLDLSGGPGNLTNNGTITLTDNVLNLAGNFINNGNFTAGASVVTFLGATPTIGGTSPTTFANLDLSQTTSVLLGNNVTVTGTFNGPVVLTSTCPTDYTFTYNNGATVLHSCPAAPPSLAYYHMDEASWNGTANQVVDSSGNGYNAQSFNSASTDGTTPAIPGSPGTCRYGVFDNTSTGGTINQGYVQTPLPNLTTNFTVTAWIRTNNNAASGQRILIDDQNNTGGYGISLGDGGAGKIRFYSRAINPVVFDSTYIITNNNWYFVAAVADTTNRKRSIYVFSQSGTLLNASTEAAAYSGTWGTDAGPVSIGGETNASGEPPASFHFRGNLDEVQVFPAALSQGQLAQIAAETHPCLPAFPDHLVIQSSGSGLTCAASTLTIVACQDVVCTPYTGGVTGTLSASGPVNWDSSTGGTTGSGFVIAAGTNAVTKNVQVPTPGSVIFGISSAAPTPLNPTLCNFGNNAPANNNCVFTANSAGFIFSNTSSPGNVYTIPPQISGIAASGLYLRAVQASTTNAAVCTPAIANSTAAVNMGYSCNNPATCQPGSLATINTTAVASAGTPVSLSFDANGSASIAARYDDVGQITLNANATVTPFGGSSPITISGSSNPYIVAPHHFGFSAITAAPIKAGNNFSATVTAYNGLGTPTATGNFGLETAPESVTLTFSKCQPTGTSSSNGTLSGGVGAFAGGVANATNLNWSEVGNGDLVATLTSGTTNNCSVLPSHDGYLCSGLSATGNTGTGGTICSGGVGNVGRFIPDHFDTVVAPGMPCPTGLTCPKVVVANDQGFVYSGQPFTTNVYARNAAGGTTANYDGTANTSPNFAKSVTLAVWDALGSTTTNNPPASSGSSLGNGVITAASFSQGTTYLGTPATPIYTFGTTPTAPTSIYIRAADADATSLQVPAGSSTEGGILVVSGRISISNAHGSEVLQLPIPVTAQYWNATSGWITSSTDSSSSFVVATPTAASAVNFNNFQNNLTAISVVGSPKSVTLSGGTGGYILAKPGTYGSVDMLIPAVTGASCLVAPIPLGCYLPSNIARAAFGIYKGPNQFIYQRENY